MRRLLAVLALAAVPAFAATWPQKGDVVYVNGKLRTLDVAFLSFDPKRYVTEPCIALRVTSASESKIAVADPAKVRFSLCGDWSSAIYASADACQAGAPIQVVSGKRNCQEIVK